MRASARNGRTPVDTTLLVYNIVIWCLHADPKQPVVLTLHTANMRFVHPCQRLTIRSAKPLYSHSYQVKLNSYHRFRFQDTGMRRDYYCCSSFGKQGLKPQASCHAYSMHTTTLCSYNSCCMSAEQCHLLPLCGSCGGCVGSDEASHASRIASLETCLWEFYRHSGMQGGSRCMHTIPAGVFYGTPSLHSLRSLGVHVSERKKKRSQPQTQFTRTKGFPIRYSEINTRWSNLG